MESLVSYGSDDEGSEYYQEMKDSLHGGRPNDRLERPGGDDTNYDNVRMDMSEDSNNNNSSGDSSSEDDKSSSSGSSTSSGGRGNLPSLVSRSGGSMIKSPTHSSPKDSRLERDSKRFRELLKAGSDHRSAKTDFEKEQRREYQDVKHSSRDKEKYRPGKEKRDRRSRSHDRQDQPGKSRPRSREIDPRPKRSSPEHRHRSRSPQSRHSYVSSHSKHSDVSRSSRSGDQDRRDRQRSRSRDRRSRSRDQRRSRSRDRRSRSRDRPGKDGHRRRGYEKKPNKLTVLERLGIELRAPEVPPPVTPQLLLQRSIEAQVQQVKSSTGIELPKYYNPAAMNPARYAEQMHKRKLLWGNKSTKPEAAAAAVPVDKPAAQTSNNKWEGTTFAQDQDGKMTAKFKRLMGIKDAAPSGATSSAAVNGTPNPEGSEILKKQEELFNSMEMQYEVARVATHTHRGLGLGFGTFQYPR